jgi:hypothetical protein
MAKKKRHGSKKMTLPMAIMAPVGMMAYYTAQNISRKDDTQLLKDYVGYDNHAKTWNLAGPVQFYGPLAVGAAIHFLAGRFGVNRALGRAGIPFIRI